MFADEELVMELLVNAGQVHVLTRWKPYVVPGKRLAGRNSANGQF